MNHVTLTKILLKALLGARPQHDPPQQPQRIRWRNGIVEVRLSQPDDHTHIQVMQHLDLSDEEAAALIKELADITGDDRYPFSARIQTLRAILAKLRPEPAREPLPPPKVYVPPRATAGRRRR